MQIASNAEVLDVRENNGRVLYRTDGVTQIPVVGSSVFCVDSGRLSDDELLFFNNNFVLPSQKNPFRSAMSFANLQRTRLV